MPASLRRGRSASWALLLLAVMTPVALRPGDGSASAAAGDPGGRRSARVDSEWPHKLDPPLRMVALGTTRTQGRFTDRIPAQSAAAIQALPAFVRAERESAEPLLYVKARIADAGPLAAASGDAAGRGDSLPQDAGRVPRAGGAAPADRVAQGGALLPHPERCQHQQRLRRLARRERELRDARGGRHR